MFPPCSRPPPTHASTGDFWTPIGKSGSVSRRVTAPFPGSSCTRFCLCPPRVNFQVLCKVWQLYGGINGDLLQEGLCHTQVCCTQSPCPCDGPPLTCTSTGHAQTQFCLCLCGFPGSWCTKGLFEPSEHHWWEWGLILNTNSPLLPPCWGFSFALWRWVSPQIHSSAYHPTGVSLTLDEGYPLLAGPVKHSHSSWPWTWGISSRLLHIIIMCIISVYKCSHFSW